ncbi:MAG TPA: hypothetical protein VKW78_01205 [Terriglobales bacterium]|nr:hypothetical protein [Terriglobales bacterium]
MLMIMKTSVTTGFVSALSSRRCSWLLALVLFSFPVLCAAQTCDMGDDIDAATRTAVQQTAQRYFQMASRSDSASLQQNAIASLAADFSGIQYSLSQNKDNLAGATATPQGTYLLSETTAPANGRAEFFCGIYNSPDRVSFVIPNLTPGKYAVVVENVSGGKQPMQLTFVLQQDASGAWKLGGIYPRSKEIAGHDQDWYIAQARQYKAKGNNFDAWYYYVVAWDMAAPVDFMFNVAKDKVADEMQAVRPPDLPSPDKPLTVTGNGKTFQFVQMFPVEYEKGLYLVMKYRVPQLGSNAQMFADNTDAMKAMVAKYPQLREAFAGLVARALDPSGQDYGTPLAMNNIK